MVFEMPCCRAWFAPLVALALLTLPACGGTRHEIEGDVLRVRLDEYRIQPQDVRVRAGELRIVARNVGRLSHNVKVIKLDEGNRERTAREIGGVLTAQPGEVVVAEQPVRLRPGRYRMLCTIGNHDDLGQYGTIEVVR